MLINIFIFFSLCPYIITLTISFFSAFGGIPITNEDGLHFFIYGLDAVKYILNKMIEYGCSPKYFFFVPITVILFIICIIVKLKSKKTKDGNKEKK